MAKNKSSTDASSVKRPRFLKRQLDSLREKVKGLLKGKAKIKKVSPARAEPKDFSPQQQVAESKYYTGQPAQHIAPKRLYPTELPSGYGADKIVLQVRDPWWIHAYWEFITETRNRLIQELDEVFFRAQPALRVYDVSNIIFDGKNAHRYFDIDIQFEAANWYIDVGGPGRSWCVDLGLRLPDGSFLVIARSNVVSTPLDGPSWITDEEWMVPEDIFARLYGMGFGFGRSSPVGKGWQEQVRRQFISSPGVSSSPVRKMVEVEKGFWLVVDAELIVYGVTEPSAKVTVQGRPISLRNDGTFSLRFALPNGRQVIPVKAVSSDGVDEKTITPIVTRETR